MERLEMSIYQKTLNSLMEVKTMSSHMAALGKIKVPSEDTALNQLIEAVIRELQIEYATRKSKSTPVSLDKATAPEFKRLVEYCQRAIGSKKPEWQILAERHGWAPKA
jgi:hypothetical protein